MSHRTSATALHISTAPPFQISKGFLFISNFPLPPLNPSFFYFLSLLDLIDFNSI
jgi:hypothetical protein